MMSRSLCLALLALGCDGGAPPAVDAGPPPIVLTVTAASRTDSVALEAGGNPAEPRAGSDFIVLDVTLEARTVGPLPIAPNAFTLILADGARSIASAQVTNSALDGCRSRSVPLGGSASCKAVFEIEETAAAPASLEWDSGTQMLTVPVPVIP